ncbi:MAG: hotdog fold domain-containing protein [Gemmatimonadales bacterium]
MSSISRSLGTLWRRLAPLPGGTWLFSRIFGRFVPYSGSVGATIEALEPGYCRASLRDRRRVRNHLNSVHAVALVNLGEMTSGLAMTMALPDEIRGIVTDIGAVYLKKARGSLTAEARVTVPSVGTEPVELRVETSIADSAGTEVCRVHTVWRLARNRS